MRGIKNVVGAVALALSTAAAADTITVNWNSPVFNPASVDVGTIIHPGGSTGTNAGRFSGTVSATTVIPQSELYQSAASFFAYCHDLAQILSASTYTVSYGASAVMLDFLGAVNSVLGGDVYAWIATSSSTVHAAVQLGIWEALHNDGFVLNAGSVSVNLASVPDTVEAQYNSFITAMAGAGSLDAQYVMVLTNERTQDVITARQPGEQLVPEPGSLALLGIAFAAGPSRAAVATDPRHVLRKTEPPRLRFRFSCREKRFRRFV